ncbi:MAG: hypothetical protein ACRDBL_04555 [Rhabdaerophilum sp.]
MNTQENGVGAGFAVGSIWGGEAPFTLLAMERALIELRELDWRAPGDGRSPFAKDGPWHLAQPEVGDVAGEYSETLLVNEAGKELQVRKLDSPRPRVPLRMAEVDRLEVLRGWLLLLPDESDRRVLWAASWHLWRGEAFDWKAAAARIGWQRSVTRLAGRYREALAKLVCAVNGVPARHHRALLAREAGYFTSAARQESLGFGAVKW